MIKVLALAALAAFAATGSVSARDYQLHSLRIDHPFARATPPGARSGGVFLSIENKGAKPDVLLHVSTPVAGTAEIHQMVMDAGVMRMRAVERIDVKPGERVMLRPGGYHVMLTDLKRPLHAGDSFPLTLGFEKAGSIEVNVEVESMAAGAMQPHVNP